MYNCHKCGKEFKYKSKLSEHLNRKNPCKNVMVGENDVMVLAENVMVGEKNVMVDSKIKNQCENCKKIFKNRQGKYEHKKNVRCKYVETPEEKIARLEKENEELRSRPQNITINNITNNNNSVNQYNITYDNKRRYLETTDPEAPSPGLLCFDGFKREAMSMMLLEDGKISEMESIIDSLRHSSMKDYDRLWKFLFRNNDLKHLHMFMLKKNNNTTHIDVFIKGNRESTQKEIFYDSMAQFISQYIIHLSMDNYDIVNMITNDMNSKKCFYEVARQDSDVFDYFLSNKLIEMGSF